MDLNLPNFATFSRPFDAPAIPPVVPSNPVIVPPSTLATLLITPIMGRYRSPSGSGEEYDAWDERSPGSNTRGRTPSRPALSARPAPGTAEYNLNFGQPSRPSAAQGTAFPGASARRQATTQLTTQPGLINPQEVRREALDREVAERLQHEEMENAGSQSGYYGEDGYATDSVSHSCYSTMKCSD